MRIAALASWLCTVAALVLPDARSIRGRARADVHLLDVAEVADTKAAVVSALKYNKALTEEGNGLLQSLIETQTLPGAGEPWWKGKLILRSCNPLKMALKSRGGPLLDGAPVMVRIDDSGEVEVETDMLVLGCATGLRFFGAAVVDGDALKVTLNACEFFEPSEEFGITKALNKCEAEVRPKLPSDEMPLTASLTAVFSDEEMLCVRASTDDTDAEDMILVLSRDDAAFDVAKRRRG